MTNEHQHGKLHTCIVAVWRRELILHTSAGLLALCRWGIPLFLAGMAVDWMIDLPAPVRVLILLSLLAVSAHKAWRAGWQQIRPFNATHMALRLEGYLGGLESLLVTAVELRNATVPGGSPSLTAATCRRAEEAVAPVRPAQTVRYHGLSRPMKIVLALVLGIGLFAVVNGPFLVAGMTRFFAPWLAVSYPTRTQLEVASGDQVVKEGSPVRIQAQVSGAVPKEASLYLRTGQGNPRKHALTIVDGRCAYTVEAAFRSFEYRVTAGDARGEWQAVEVVPSPRITHADVTLEFPEYTQRAAETIEALTVTVPEGTRMKWKLTLDRGVSRADVDFGSGKAFPLELSPDGLTVTMQQVAIESRAYSFSWVGKEHGFSYTSSSHYLQVEPDQAPHVELTSPKANLYATLGRKLDLAFRGRDDHGLGELVVAYRVNKTEEEKVPFGPPPLCAGEQKIDWDYRTVLPQLAIGDSVSFVVELADRYPGPNGPHRARSQSRRISFLSREEYLEQIAQQRQRLYARLLATYREERVVHNVVRRLDPADEAFAQTCQLEAVRQDLMRERLNGLREVMKDLLEDLAANNIKDASEIETFTKLGADLQTIADEYMARAATGLRALAAAAHNARTGGTLDSADAVHMVDSTARELACLMMQMGFREASEAMARELHATAQAQASLRAKTLTIGKDKAGSLPEAQNQLSLWLTRLLAAAPGHKESTVEEALVAFNLSLLAKKLQRTDLVSAKMSEAATAIGKAELDVAARLQAEVIKALLYAEFRLRVGSEHEALVDAGELFMSLARDQKKLRVESAALTPEEFSKRQSDIGRVEAAMFEKLRLLLMPSIPARRTRLFDTQLPSPPPVYEVLAAAEGAMAKAAAHVAAGDWDKAAIQQQEAETSFDGLSAITGQRIETLTERVRMKALALMVGDCLTKVSLFAERQAALLEKTEDAAVDKTESAHLAGLEQLLAADIEQFCTRTAAEQKALGGGSEALSRLMGGLDSAVRFMKDADPLLSGNQPGKANAYQQKAHAALKESSNLFGEYQTAAAVNSGTLAALHGVSKPGLHVADILDEQRDLIAAMRKLKPAELPSLAIAQKNLVHAVNAVLDSLDVFAHLIDTNTVMLFAKDDMKAAGEALAGGDLEEAIDAATAVEKALQKLGAQIDNLAPQYGYVREVEEALLEIVPDVLMLPAEQRRLREDTKAAADTAALGALAVEQRALAGRAEAVAGRLRNVTGKQHLSDALKHMKEAINALGAGDRAAAVEQMNLAEGAIADATSKSVGDGAPAVPVKSTLNEEKAALLALMELLPFVLAPPAEPGKPLSPEIVVARKLLAMASEQRKLYWNTQQATAEQVAGLAPAQRALVTGCEALLQLLKSHPNLVAAIRHMSEAALSLTASSRDKAITSQKEAGEAMRYLLIEYALQNLVVPEPASSSDDGTPSDRESDSEFYKVFMPGAVSGNKPKDGRQKWEVLGSRERAALNENFARELPLEYRAILKDYYERLAK